MSRVSKTVPLIGPRSQNENPRPAFHQAGAKEGSRPTTPLLLFDRHGQASERSSIYIAPEASSFDVELARLLANSADIVLSMVFRRPAPILLRSAVARIPTSSLSITAR